MKLKNIGIISCAFLLVSCGMPIDADKAGIVIDEIIENYGRKNSEKEITKLTFINYQESEKRRVEYKSTENIKNTFSIDLDDKVFYQKIETFKCEIDDGYEYVENNSIIEQIVWYENNTTYFAIISNNKIIDAEIREYNTFDMTYETFETMINTYINELVLQANPSQYLTHYVGMNEIMYNYVVESIREDGGSCNISFASLGDGSFSANTYAKYEEESNDIYYEQKECLEIYDYLLAKHERQEISFPTGYGEYEINKEKEGVEFKFGQSTYNKPSLSSLKFNEELSV